MHLHWYQPVVHNFAYGYVNVNENEEFEEAHEGAEDDDVDADDADGRSTDGGVDPD